MAFNVPPCSRYDTGENDLRVSNVWHYFAGRIGGGEAADRVARRIARLFDLKGTLLVATFAPLSPEHEALIRDAWREVALEGAHNVRFVDVASEDWEEEWCARRFDTDWVPGTSGYADFVYPAVREE